MCGGGAACPRGSQGGGAGQDELPVGSALHPRAHARRHERACEARRAAADPGAQPVEDPVDHSRGRGHRVHRAPAPGARRNRLRALRTSRPAGHMPRRGRSRAGRRGPRALHVLVAALARRPGGGRPLHRRARRRARHLRHACRRGGRPPLERRRRGRRLEPLSGLAQRPRPGLPLPRRSPGGDPRRGDVYPVARGRLVRVRLPDRSRGQAADPPHGPPRRGQRRAQGSRGLLAAQARRAPRPRRADRRPRQEHLHEAAVDGRDAGLLPRLVRAGLGAGRRRRALQGPGDRAGHARRAVDGPHARRARAAGARRPGRDRRSDAHLGGRARPRLPARLPLRQSRHTGGAPVPGPLRAGA